MRDRQHATAHHKFFQTAPYTIRTLHNIGVIIKLSEIGLLLVLL